MNYLKHKLFFIKPNLNKHIQKKITQTTLILVIMVHLTTNLLRAMLPLQLQLEKEKNNNLKNLLTILKKMYLPYIDKCFFQVKRCKEVLAKKDYYEILCLTKGATEDQIKKSYRKLALKFHPDKNKAPNSTEAFKKISQAFACLSNPEKKKIYDEHGTEENF